MYKIDIKVNALLLITLLKMAECMQSECIQSECTICLLDYTEETKKTTECSHIFHRECLDKWLETNNSCPLCRTLLQKQQHFPILNGTPTFGSVSVTLDEVWSLIESIAAADDEEDDEEDEYTRIYGSYIRENFD